MAHDVVTSNLGGFIAPCSSSALAPGLNFCYLGLESSLRGIYWGSSSFVPCPGSRGQALHEGDTLCLLWLPGDSLSTCQQTFLWPTSPPVFRQSSWSVPCEGPESFVQHNRTSSTLCLIVSSNSDQMESNAASIFS
jgi:hypothetical protein